MDGQNFAEFDFIGNRSISGPTFRFVVNLSHNLRVHEIDVMAWGFGQISFELDSIQALIQIKLHIFF